jgi:RNA methyltransferase, TrmH family
VPRSKQPDLATAAELKFLRSLLRDKRARDESRLFVAEGPRLVAAALERGAPVATVYVSEDGNDDVVTEAETRGVAVRGISARDAERVGDTRTPQPVFATVTRDRATEPALADADLALVATINDPGNAGTLWRSAGAAGAQALGLGAGSVDAYNPKVVRASAGACFVVAAVEGLRPVEMLEPMGERGVQRLGAVARGGRPPEAFDLTQPTCFVLGHETRGLDAALPLDALVTIPMHESESLNVAMAGTVLLFEAARQRRRT